MVTGIVKWFDEERNFGILAQDDGPEDIFCHFSVIHADGCQKALAEGQKVEFELHDLPEGRFAANVRRVFDETGTLVTVLCGDAVQIRAFGRKPNLKTMAERLRPLGEVRLFEYMVRLRAPPYEMTLFDDGRAILKGTGDEAVARQIATDWLGVRIPL
jgi:cold shock CspA family protein